MLSRRFKELCFFVILCPVASLYVFGLGISAGASLWRLIKHDFGNDGGANKKPALQVLYSLAVSQGVLFGYKLIHAFATKGGLVKLVYNLHHKRVHKKLVAEYLEETVAGCEKDLSFATGRNFVTYGVDLMMEAKSSESFIAGIKVLGGAISDDDESGRKVLAKYLLTRSDDSLSSIVQRLLETVGPRSPYSREIKEHVVRILDILALFIRLDQFPRAIECLCSVVDTSGDSREWRCNDDDGNLDRYYVWTNRNKDYERGDLVENYEKLYMYENYKKLYMHEVDSTEGEENITKNITRGFDRLLIGATNIIYKFLAREDNIWILRSVSNTVLHKIATLPLKLHKDNNHDPFRPFERQKPELQMLEQCWAITERLLIALQPAATPVGEGQERRKKEENNQEIEEVEEEGNKSYLENNHDPMFLLRCSIQSTIKDSIQSTIKSIFDCLDCSAIQKSQAIEILLHLSLDMSFLKNTQSNKRRLSWILLLIFYSGVDYSRYWMVPSLTYPNNNCCDFNGIRRLAGEKLSEMLREMHELPPEETATERQLVGLALGDLKSAFDDDSEDISIRTYAIIIMEGISFLKREGISFYHGHSEVLGFVYDAFPKMVKETLILCDSKTQVTDVEKGRLQNALLSFCHHIEYLGGTLGDELKEIASKTCEEQGKSFQDFQGLVASYVSQTNNHSQS